MSIPIITPSKSPSNTTPGTARKRYCVLHATQQARDRIKAEAATRGFTVHEFLNFLAANLEYLPEAYGEKRAPRTQKITADLEHYRIPKANGHP